MKEYNEWHIELLNTIKTNGNVGNLIFAGHDFIEVMDSISDMIEDGLVTSTEYNYVLTEYGLSYFLKYSQRKGLYKFVYEDRQVFKERMPIDAIYIPRKRKG